MPEIVRTAVNSRACRSAIMFGDQLEAHRQADLIAALRRCDLPFQCAHGRPRYTLCCVCRCVAAVLCVCVLESDWWNEDLTK